ncbi:putative reverse transcriptase domain-containing protein [Tanacetum coccineum]
MTFYAIGNFSFYAMADLGASVNVLPRNIFEYLKLTNLSKTEMLVEMADMRKKAPLGIVRDILVKIDKFLFPSDFVILDQTPNSTVILGRPFLATVHAQISVFEKEISIWIGDERFTKALDPDKDPLERCLDEYNWVFNKEIEQLADEYEIKIREKGQVLEEIWIKCKRARRKNKDWWYDYCFICVNGENSETLSLGRKNGSRFRKMIMEEMEEVPGNDGEDFDNET